MANARCGLAIMEIPIGFCIDARLLWRLCGPCPDRILKWSRICRTPSLPNPVPHMPLFAHSKRLFRTKAYQKSAGIKSCYLRHRLRPANRLSRIALINFLHDASGFAESRRPLWGREFAKPSCGLPTGAERHAKKPKTYTVSYTYRQISLKICVKTAC